MAFAVQRHLNARLGKAAPVVGAAVFAAPTVGPPQFVAAYNQLVNSRRLAFQFDIVPQVSEGAACNRRMPCPPRLQLWADAWHMRACTPR